MRSLSTFGSAVALISLATLGACAVRIPRELDGWVSTPSVDTVAAHRVELELQRIALLATVPTDSVSIRHVDAQLATLRDRVHILPNHDAAERIGVERVVLALDARESIVTARLRDLRLVYTDQCPTVRQAMEEERLLQERKAALRGASH